MSGETQVKYIFHISDIHIMERNYTNLKNSFRILVERIKEKGISTSLLVICGDIFETKSSLQTDDIFHYRAICKLLKSANIKTLIIPGNHDYNTNSELVRDNVTLLSAGYKNILCINETGVYTNVHDISSIEFHVFSPIDKQIPVFGEKHTNKKKIALLHEPINYAVYDNGETIADARFNAGDLKRYDYVLLGDIHLHQYLDDHMAYSGSFVQKTKGEGITKGYILWDLENDQSDFFAIPLKELYIKIDARNDTCDLPDVEKWQKIRHTSLFYRNCSTTYIEDLKLQMQAKYGYINRIVNSTTLAKIDKKEKELIRESISHEQIISELLKNDSSLPKILEHHAKVLKDRGETTCTTYKLNYLYWSNILCYGEDNYINFNDFNSNLIMLNGKNKEGKSSIIDILIRVLFNECERGYKEDIVNKSKTKGFIKFSFNIGEDEYIIEQVYNRVAKKQFHRLFKNKANITKDTIVQTYEFLVKTIGIGEYKNFVNLTTALQNRKFLVDMAPKDFVSLLTKITNVDILKDVEDENKKEISAMKRINKECEAELKKLPEIKPEELIQLENKVIDLESNRIECINNINEINKKLIEISKGYDNTPIPVELTSLLDNTHNNIIHYKSLCKITLLRDQKSTKFQKYKKIITILEKLCTMESDEIRNTFIASSARFDLHEFNDFNSLLNKYIWKADDLLKTLSEEDCKRICSADYSNIKITSDFAQVKIDTIQNEIDKLLEITSKPMQSNFRSREELERSIANFKKQEYLPLEKCSIQSIIELDESHKNDKLLEAGLPNYKSIEKDIENLEKKISNFTNNFGSLEFSEHCEKCSGNRSKIYGIFDIKLEMGNLTNLKHIYDSRIDTQQQFANAVEYKKLKEQNEIFLRNEKIKHENEIITNSNLQHQNNIQELKDLENHKRWEKIIMLRKELDKYLNYKQQYNEKEMQNILHRSDNFKPLKKLIDYILEYIELIRLFNIQKSNGEKTEIIEKLNSYNSIADQNLHEINEKISITTKQFQTSKNQFDNRTTLMNKISVNNEKIVFLETYAKVISSKTGIPSYVILNTCKSVQAKCNAILGKITDFTLDIVFDKEVKIYTMENNIRIPAQMASGMQKFVLDLIFRITLTEISSISCTRTLFVDEGFGALDKENFISIANILQKLKGNFDSLFIISHIAELNSYVDVSVNIVKNGYLSHVQHGTLTDEQKQLALVQFMEDNSSNNKEFKATKKKAKMMEEDESIKDYCNENGGIESILFDNPQLTDDTDTLYCKGCDRTLKNRAGAKEKHAVSKTYNRQHMKYILGLINNAETAAV